MNPAEEFSKAGFFDVACCTYLKLFYLVSATKNLYWNKYGQSHCCNKKKYSKKSRHIILESNHDHCCYTTDGSGGPSYFLRKPIPQVKPNAQTQKHQLGNQLIIQ
jgi:hypothetical protein